MVVVQGFRIKATCYLNSPCGTILHQKTILKNEKIKVHFLNFFTKMNLDFFNKKSSFWCKLVPQGEFR